MFRLLSALANLPSYAQASTEFADFDHRTLRRDGTVPVSSVELSRRLGIALGVVFRRTVAQQRQ